MNRVQNTAPCIGGCGGVGLPLYLGYCKECAEEALFTEEGMPRPQYRKRLREAEREFERRLR
jgi:hypothetical protein